MNNKTMVTRWWWVRHAPVVGHEGVIYGDGEVPCDTSERPRFQALAGALPADAVWVTSHLSRAKDTAGAIRAEGLAGADPLEEPALKEQGFGDWQWRKWDDLHGAEGPDYEAFWSDPAHNKAPNGESFADMMERTGEAVARLTEAHAGRDIVAVAHGGTIRAALAVALDIPPNRALGVKISNLSLTRLEHVDGGILHGRGGAWRVVGVNLKP